MRFLVRGRVFDRTTGREHDAEVEWRDPATERTTIRLVGDGFAVAHASYLAQSKSPIRLTATGPEIEADLDEPQAALATVCSVFLPGYEVEGDVEPREVDLPDGAIS